MFDGPKKKPAGQNAECQCLDCRTVVVFDEQPGDATCQGCGLRMYVTADGRLGRYLPDDWRPGGIQGRR